jgi:thiol-disulfide isomerase/thioredoxin
LSENLLSENLLSSRSKGEVHFDLHEPRSIHRVFRQFADFRKIINSLPGSLAFEANSPAHCLAQVMALCRDPSLLPLTKTRAIFAGTAQPGEQFMRQILSLLLLGAFLTSSTTFAVAQDADKKKDEAKEAPTELELYKSVSTALNARKFDDAEEGLKDFEKRFPNSLRLNTLQYQAYYTYARNRKTSDAARHIAAVVDRAVEQLPKNPRGAASLSSYTSALISTLQRTGKAKEAAAKLDEVLAALDKANDGSIPAVAQGYSSLIYNKAMMIRTEKPDDAFDLVTSEVGKAKTAFDAKSDDAATLQWYASTRYSQMVVASSASPDNFKKLRDDHLEFVTDQAGQKDAAVVAAQAAQKTATDVKTAADKALVEANKGTDDAVKKIAQAAATKAAKELTAATQATQNAEAARFVVINVFTSAQYYGIATMVSEDVDRAEKLLASATELLDGIDATDPRIKSAVKSSRTRLASNNRRIAVAKKHQALIGTDAVALDAAAWANGEALGDEDLKGKVVLLDFWAVWCGPCIATFPHLIEWNEKYADKGLVIIGATRYYQRGWNAELNRITPRDPKLAPEAERAAMVQFAKYHKLTHRFMVTPSGSKFQTDYGVSGIPQAVLIGRDGKVRMIKVGSGSANAAALHDEIEKLLAE